jgi:hypothetical protein
MEKYMKTYSVRIFYFNEKYYSGRALKTGLSLKEAQDICGDKEGSWSTCTKPHLKRRTREKGMWFLGYTAD